MKISTKGRYGLRAVIDLAANCQGENAPVRASVKEIARRQGLSENYLEQLIFPLKKAGILQSVRGAQGGYFLAKPADKIRPARFYAPWRAIWPTLNVYVKTKAPAVDALKFVWPCRYGKNCKPL